MDYRKREFHEGGVYPMQYILRMGTARVKQEEETDTVVIIEREYSKKSGRKEHGHEGKKSRTRPNWR